jgi:ribonuclease PH
VHALKKKSYCDFVEGGNSGSCISTAEGSALIRQGNTTVVCGIKAVSCCYASFAPASYQRQPKQQQINMKEYSCMRKDKAGFEKSVLFILSFELYM